MGARAFSTLIFVLAGILLLSASTFVVREQEQALRVQFNTIIGKDFKPGLHFKVPFVDNIIKFDNRVLTEVRRRTVPDQRKPGADHRLLHQVAHPRRAAVLSGHGWR